MIFGLRIYGDMVDRLTVDQPYSFLLGYDDDDNFKFLVSRKHNLFKLRDYYYFIKHNNNEIYDSDLTTYTVDQFFKRILKSKSIIINESLILSPMLQRHILTNHMK